MFINRETLERCEILCSSMAGSFDPLIITRGLQEGKWGFATGGGEGGGGDDDDLIDVYSYTCNIT